MIKANIEVETENKPINIAQTFLPQMTRKKEIWFQNNQIRCEKSSKKPNAITIFEHNFPVRNNIRKSENCTATKKRYMQVLYRLSRGTNFHPRKSAKSRKKNKTKSDYNFTQGSAGVKWNKRNFWTRDLRFQDIYYTPTNALFRYWPSSFHHLSNFSKRT